MDTSVISCKNSKTYKTPYNVEKNFAPCTVPNQGTTATTKLYNARQSKQQIAYKLKESQARSLQANANFKAQETFVAPAKAVEKQAKRANFQRRVAQRDERFEKYVAVPKNLSPWLNLSLHLDLTLPQRLAKYNEKHKCIHGRRHTAFITHYSVLKATPGSSKAAMQTLVDAPIRRLVGDNVIQSSTLVNMNRRAVYLEPTCYCVTEKKSALTKQHHCGHCTNPTLDALHDSTFPGDILNCRFCGYNWYRIFSTWQRGRPQGLTVIRPKPEPQISLPSTEKTWGEVPKQKILATFDSSEWPTLVDHESGVLDSIKSVWDSISATLTNFVDWVEGAIFDAAARIAWIRIKSHFVEIQKSLGRFFASATLTRMHQFWRLLVTESAAERGFLIAALVEEIFLPSSSFVSLISSFLGIAPMYSAQNLNVFTRKESGEGMFDWLLSLFPSAPGLLNLLKHFNTVMSSWKNLHELVNNFLEYLPSFMKKLFTVTDPRKRYGVECHTSGNPVYDMHQAYLNLLQGENCASALAYEQFVILWKRADDYIVKEYQPNELVYRLNKHFMTNAHSIMRPSTRGSKPIPFVVTLYGPPGSGKSASWPILLSGIVPGNYEDIRGKSYTRNPVSDYFDGYNPEKHKIFVYDDFGSQVDDEAASELMSIVSNADYLPNYASLNDPAVGVKGTSFDSAIVVLCTNFNDFSHCKQIADKVALKRRLGIIIRWDRRSTNDAIQYEVRRAQPDGTQEPVVKSDGTFTYTVPELQDLLMREYVRHFDEQNATRDKFNRFLSRNRLQTDFMEHYKEAMPARTEVIPVTVTHQVGDQVDYDKSSLMYIKNGTDDDVFIREVYKDSKRKRRFGFHAIVDIVSGFAEQHTPTMKVVLLSIAAISSALMVVYLGFKLVGLWMPTIADEESGQSATAKVARQPVFARPVRTVPVKHEQGEYSDSAIIAKITKNQVTLVNDMAQFVNGVFLCGRILITVKHFVQISKTIQIVSFRANDPEQFTVDLADCQVVEFKGADLALIALPVGINHYADIRKYILSSTFNKKTTGYAVRTWTSYPEKFLCDVEPGSHELVTNFRGETQRFICELKYTLEHRKGDCGNMLFAYADGNLKIIGIHTDGAISSDDCYAVMLNKDEIDMYVAQINVLARIPLEDTLRYEKVLHEDGVGFNKTNFVAEVAQHITSSGDTKLRRSELFDVIHPHSTKPVLLRRTQGKDPMVLALKKYGLSCTQFPIRETEMAIDSIIEELMQHKREGDLDRELTLHECLNGIPGVVESVDLSTSSGYPYSLFLDKKGAKRRVIDGEPGELRLSEFAQQHYDLWYDMLQRLVIPMEMWLATLKDEKRKIEKVDLGKTRVFCAGSLTSFMHNKRLFGGFCAFFKRINANTFSTLGMNRASLEWDRMIKRFLEVGSKILDGDQEHWDGKFKSFIAMRCQRIFDAFYNDKPGTSTHFQRYILFCHAVFAFIRVTWPLSGSSEMFSIIIQVLGLMPSGWYLTFVLNCLVNACLMRIGWIFLVSAPFNDLYYFREFVRDKYAGDDNALAVADRFIDEFNNLTLAQFLATYDQVYTPSSKSGELVAFQSIYDFAFLKTKTGVAYERYVPLFDMDANMDTLNYVRVCDDMSKACEDNCNDVLRNLFFYGKEKFSEVRSKILSHKPSYNMIGYHSLESAYLGYGSIPDPYGSFGYTRRAVRDPNAFYRALERTIASAEKSFETIGSCVGQSL